MNTSLDSLDLLVLGLYFAILIGVAIWVILQKNKDTEDYFLAGRNAGWFVIGASIFASNIGSEHVVGLAGTGAESGMPMAHYELHAWIVLLLGWFFLPFYMRSGVFTMPEFLERRYDSRARWFLSIFSILGYVLTKVSVTIYAGGIVVSQLLGIDFWTGALATVLITGVYTILGGMRAVIYTEALQTVVLLVGAFIVTKLGLDAVGGWSELKDFVVNNPIDPNQPHINHFNMWRPPNDPNFPWTGMLIGGTIVGIWYWCTDQYIVQRTLAANNIKIGRRGAIFGAYLKLMPVFLFLLPGIIAFVLKEKGLMHYDKADQVFPALVQYLLPSGIKGLVAGGLMAALMSSLASVFNSASTLFTVDVFKKLYPTTPEKRLVRIGQIATAFIVLLGIIWIPIMEKIGGGTLYKYLQSVQAYIAPPITTVFLLGLLWKRINASGAIATLFTGLVVGTLRIIAELTSLDSTGKVIEGTNVLVASFASINFAHMCIFMFLFCCAVCIGVSLLTAAPSEEQLAGLTFGTLSDEQRAAARNSFSMVDIISSLLIIAVVIAILSYFTG